MPFELSPGQTSKIVLTVDHAMTAAHFARNAGEAYPAVLATPILVAEMERACAGMLAPLLAPGELSVGAVVEMSHQAPTPVGAQVTTFAKFIERADPLFWFEVWAEDPGGVIGRGRHARAIVERQRIERRAEARIPADQGGR